MPAHTQATDRDTSFDDLFAGRIAEDRIQEVFKTLGLEDVSPYGLRVICGGEVATYLRIHSADLLVRAGDVILRLAPRENESGVDVAEWVQPITAGFDCDQASTTAEQLICMDFDVAKLDRTIARRYAALRHDVSEASFATIQTTRDRQRGAGRQPEELRHDAELATRGRWLFTVSVPGLAVSGNSPAPKCATG